MGRSVSYLNRAIEKAFFDVSLFTIDGKIEGLDENDNEILREPDDLDYQDNWDNFYSNVKYSFRGKFDLDECKDKWDGRETSIIFENNFCEIGVSEYCGLASVSIRVNESYYKGELRERVAKAWIESVWPDMLKSMDENVHNERLNKVGSFSNGEGVYESANKKD